MTPSESALRETLERTLRELDYDRIVDISDLLADLMPVISAALADKDIGWNELIDREIREVGRLKAQIAALTEQRDAAEDRQLERGAQLSELHGALAERDAQIAILEKQWDALEAAWMAKRTCGACEEHQHVCVKHHERVLEELATANSTLSEQEQQIAALERLVKEPVTELHHAQCPWFAADTIRHRSVCGCPPGWPKITFALRETPAPPQALGGVPVKLDPSIPQDEVWVEDANGRRRVWPAPPQEPG